MKGKHQNIKKTTIPCINCHQTNFVYLRFFRPFQAGHAIPSVQADLGDQAGLNVRVGRAHRVSLADREGRADPECNECNEKSVQWLAVAKILKKWLAAIECTYPCTGEHFLRIITSEDG